MTAPRHIAARIVGEGTASAWGIGAALLVASPALVTGPAVIRGRAR